MLNSILYSASKSAAVFLALIGAATVSPLSWAQELSKGHRVLLDKGLQIQAVTVPEYNAGYFSVRDFRLSRFTSINMGHAGSYHPEWYGQPGDYTASVTLMHPSVPIGPARDMARNLVALQYLDEQNLSDPVVRADTKRWFEAMRRDAAFDSTILYTNQFGFQIPVSDLRTYMAESRPDMLMFDEYLVGSASPYFFSNGSPTGVYMAQMKYRNLALAGNDGTGRNPIPYGKYIQSFSTNFTASPESVRGGYRLSESDIRLDQFGAWAMGYTYAAAFTYDSMEPAYAPFDALIFSGDGSRVRRTTEFRYFAETNRQSRNIGPALVRLQNTDIRILTGELSNRDHGIPEWNTAADADPYMTGLSVTNPGAVLDGARGDVLVGFFKPLPGLASGDLANDQYFMVVNGLSGEFALAADAAQMIRLDFDFGTSGINALQRYSRETGLLEDVALVRDGASRYHLELLLPGGTGDLFRYDRSGSTAVPEPAASFVLLGTTAFALRRPWRRSLRA